VSRCIDETCLPEVLSRRIQFVLRSMARRVTRSTSRICHQRQKSSRRCRSVVESFKALTGSLPCMTWPSLPASLSRGATAAEVAAPYQLQVVSGPALTPLGLKL